MTNREQLNYLNTIAYWQAEMGLMNQNLDADADQDGITNLFEAAFGLDPHTPTTPMPAQSVVNAGGQNYPAIAFTHDPAIADLTPEVEWSNDLMSWSTTATTEVSRVLAGGLEIITVRSNAPSTSGPQFLRVKVTAP